jgi:hypothetical protein
LDLLEKDSVDFVKSSKRLFKSALDNLPAFKSSQKLSSHRVSQDPVQVKNLEENTANDLFRLNLLAVLGKYRDKTCYFRVLDKQIKVIRVFTPLNVIF